MPRIERSAEVVWEGNVARGRGLISAATGAFTELPYTLATRVGNPEGKTSPEELLAAAHARVLHDVARQRARAGRDTARPARSRLPDRHGRGRGAGPPDRRVGRHRQGRRGGRRSRLRSRRRSRKPTRAARSPRCSSGRVPTCRSRSDLAPVLVEVGRPQPCGRRRARELDRKRDGSHAVGLVDDVEPERRSERERLVEALHRHRPERPPRSAHRATLRAAAPRAALRAAPAARRGARRGPRSSRSARRRPAQARRARRRGGRTAPSFPAQIISSPSAAR